jgi:rod shape-determining protein MreD
VIFVFVAAVLQSTLLARVALFGAVPDLALGIVVYAAYANGMMAGQLSGFFGGLTLDLISVAPIGMNALVRTVIGALAGLVRGKVVLDWILAPVVLLAAATLVKAALLFVLGFVFKGEVPYYRPESALLWAELALNTLSAPLLFAFLRRFGALLAGKGM